MLQAKMRERIRSEWQAICPQLHIEDTNPALNANLPTDRVERAAECIRHPGYINLSDAIPADLIAPLKLGMEQLKAANIPPVYIYIFDEAWWLFESLRPLISQTLGEGYKTLPNFWAWHLVETGQTGWPPHKDCSAETVFDIGGDQMFMSLSLWVPLTDVDIDNGCMFVIPRDNEVQIPTDAEMSRDQLIDYARPLAASAGSVLGWPQDLIHWGGEYSNIQKPPRMSLSFEFQSSAFDPLATPLLDTAAPPAFEIRMELLDQQFEKYRHIA